ncbi:hypothetical protein K3495_g1579 [Podosphaera aphanis]|nr:hypothetical protein K3495_g1579 [Podosphaera aphanis]
MDELPIYFGPWPERLTDGSFEKADLDRAMEILIEIVWHNGGFRSPELIYQECATEMYVWCRAHDFYKLWAYLFVNWYTFDMWKIGLAQFVLVKSRC